MRIPEEGRPGLVRSYSLSSAPGAAEYRISVKREDRGKVSIYYTAPDLEIAGEPGITHGRMTSETSDGIRELGILADAYAYLCGPEGFMSAVTAALQRARLSSSNIHTEVFGAQPLEDPASGEMLPRCSIPTTEVLLDL
ncbi:hypothetical protein [Streptomyces mirabilis]